jgi:Peptidase family C25/Propeptide_C25
MKRFSEAVFLLVVLVCIGMGSSADTGTVPLSVKSGDYTVRNDPSGVLLIMTDCGYLCEPGKPLLPLKTLVLGLPPGAELSSIEGHGLNPRIITENMFLQPAPPVKPAIEQMFPALSTATQKQWKEQVQKSYSSDRPYPDEPIQLISTGSLRQYRYVAMSYTPFSYRPVSGRLTYYPEFKIAVKYTVSETGTECHDTVADNQVQRLFVNSDDIMPLYQTASPGNFPPENGIDFLILTTEELIPAVENAGFCSWKQSLGFTTQIIRVDDPEILASPGADTAEKIRSYLRENYLQWHLKYLLIVGNYDLIPMRYCYPYYLNHTNHAGHPDMWQTAGEVPTDYYYADLSLPDAESWDLDQDGYHGEYIHDAPDFLAEIAVGRIPSNDTDGVHYALEKIIRFEQDTGAWKEQVLHAGAIAYFANENHSGRELSDGAETLNTIEQLYMQDMTVTHFSEQDGLVPSEYPWQPLRYEPFTNAWRTGEYGLVNWSAHGWTDKVGRRVWDWDDGDNVPETGELSSPLFIDLAATLDDDKPSLVFALSCLVGYPEENDWGNMGIDLLTDPQYGAAAGVVSSSRIGWVSYGGGSELTVEYNHHLLDNPLGQRTYGEAVYDSKYYMNQYFTSHHYADYWNLYSFNLYGDPSLIREGTAPQPTPTPEPVELGVQLDMPGTEFLPGDTFFCNAVTSNPGEPILSVKLFVAMDLGIGTYWFWPGWKECPPDVDYMVFDLETGVSIQSVLEPFVWPKGAGTFSDARFIAAMIDESGAGIVGNIDTVSFGWSESP